jgi:hypothetical protein
MLGTKKNPLPEVKHPIFERMPRTEDGLETEEGANRANTTLAKFDAA